MLSNDPFLLSGSGDHACLCLHGLGGGPYETRLLAQHLQQQGLTVQGIRYPGHDQPLERMPDSVWPEWFSATLDTYQALAQEHRRVSLVGFSTGCLLALHLAHAHPVERLVLLAPFFAIRRYLPIPLEVLVNTLGQFIKDVPRAVPPIADLEMRTLAQSARYFTTFNLVATRSALELIEIVKSELPSIKTPTLIFQSSNDQTVDPAAAKEAYQALGSPIKEFVLLHRSNHCLGLDLEREQIFSQIGTFLNDQTINEEISFTDPILPDAS